MLSSTSVITVANQKGGVGKTTTVVNLASSYAQLGKKILVIDLDYQANSTSLLGVDEAQVSAGFSIARAIQEDLTLVDIRLPSKIENVDVLAATRELCELADRLVGQPNQFSLIESVLDCSQTDEYDFILIDTHPSVDCFSQSALNSSHYYLIPLFPEADSSRGLGHQIQAVEKIRRYLNPMLTFLGCVITRFDKQNATHTKFERFLRDASKDGKFRVFNTLIPVSSSVAAASAQGLALNQYKKSSPVSVAYSTLAGEILPHLKGKRTGRKLGPIKTDVLENTLEWEVAAEM